MFGSIVHAIERESAAHVQSDLANRAERSQQGQARTYRLLGARAICLGGHLVVALFLVQVVQALDHRVAHLVFQLKHARARN